MLKQLSDVLRNIDGKDQPALDTRVKPVVRILNGALAQAGEVPDQ